MDRKRRVVDDAAPVGVKEVDRRIKQRPPPKDSGRTFGQSGDIRYRAARRREGVESRVVDRPTRAVGHGRRVIDDVDGANLRGVFGGQLQRVPSGQTEISERCARMQNEHTSPSNESLKPRTKQIGQIEGNESRGGIDDPNDADARCFDRGLRQLTERDCGRTAGRDGRGLPVVGIRPDRSIADVACIEVLSRDRSSYDGCNAANRTRYCHVRFARPGSMVARNQRSRYAMGGTLRRGIRAASPRRESGPCVVFERAFSRSFCRTERGRAANCRSSSIPGAVRREGLN